MANFWQQLPKGFSVLAPMEDVTDFAFREIVATKLPKADVLFTEFTSADGLASKGYEITARKFNFSPVQRPIVAQIFGTDLEKMEKASALAAKLGFDGVDINMGCPVREVINRGAGAGMINNKVLVKNVIAAVKQGAGDLPVSVKTRLGKETVITEDWISFLLQQNIAALTVHGRTAAELSKVPANWKEIAKVVQLRNEIAPHTIIIGNGDIENFAHIQKVVNQYGVDGVMIGRGIFHNPWAFEKVDPPATHERQEYINVLLDHARLYDQTWGMTKNFEVMKKFFKMYVKDFRGANELRQKLMETHSLLEVEGILKAEGLIKSHQLIMGNSCLHLKEASLDTTPNTPEGCEECLQSGDEWVHLRLCLQCGHVGCCDDSINKHATKHFHKTKHPVIKSFEPGENWRWCYIDEIGVE